MENKSIIAVSDVHLGMKIGNDKSDDENHRESQFLDFLDTLNFNEISDFILLGDILDFWRHDYLNIIVDESCHVDRLMELKNKHAETNFHYIVGNHDYLLLWLKENGADYPIDCKKSVEVFSKNEVFYFIHGYQLEVLSWRLYKPISMYEEFCEDMCLVGEDGSRFADNLWKRYLEKITLSMNQSLTPVGKLSTHELGTRIAEPKCLFESNEITPYVAPKSLAEEISHESEELLALIEPEEEAQKRLIEEISYKSEELLALIEPEEEAQKRLTEETTHLCEISLDIKDTILKKVKEQVEGFVKKANGLKDLTKEIEFLESEINPLDPPEKRIRLRETKVVNLKKGMTELSKLREDICIERNFDLGSEITKKMFSDPLYKKLKSYYDWIRGLVIPKHIDYFTIKEIAESDVRHYMFGIKKDQYLIYGHTHEAYVDNAKKVANTGCWGIQKDTNKEFLYIKIIDDDVKIMKFIDQNKGSEEWNP